MTEDGVRKITLVLVDDHTLFVDSLKTVIETRANDIVILGIANTGQEGIELVGKYNPDVVLYDIGLPDMSGVEAVKRLTAESPSRKIMMLTTYDDEDSIQAALQNGASGYLTKDIPIEELIASIRALSQGAVLISPSIARKLVASAYKEEETGEPAPEWYLDLKPKERQILRLIARGMYNAEISYELNLVEQTVKNYVSAIYRKIGARDRIQVIKLMRDYQPSWDEV